jgi:hypothetical protein
MHSEKTLLLALIATAGVAVARPAVVQAQPAPAPAKPAPIPGAEDSWDEGQAARPAPARGSAPDPQPPAGGGIAPPWYEGQAAGAQNPPPATEPAPPPGLEGAAPLPGGRPPMNARQQRDREDPRYARQKLRAPAAPPERPATPPYLITSTTPVQPAVRVESPDSSSAAAKRNNANGPQASPNKINTEDLIRRARTNVNFYELVDEILDEIAYQLSKQDAMAMSPLAVRLVRLSPDLRPEFAGTLEARLLARISQVTSIRTAVCIECNSMRSRVENGQWLVSLGAVRQEDLQRIGRSQGIKTFLDIDFTFNPQANTIWMEAIAFRASDGGVVWSDAYRSDATTAMLLRSGRRVPSRAERLDELEHKMEGRPYFGYMVSVGLARLGYNGPTGDIGGPMATIRIHERFGENQQQLFGLSVGIFFTGAPEAGKNVLNSLMSGAYYSMNLSEPSLNQPELWAYGELGGMFSGNQGNTFYGEGGLDLHLKWRLSMVGGLQYVLPTHFADHDLGGLGYRLRLAFNW